MSTYIIADLHLAENQPVLINAFSNFYEKITYLNDRVIIAGDMFDVFVGVDDKSNFHQKIRRIIEKASQRGVTTLFQRGNRDFLMTESMANFFGMKLIGNYYSMPTVNGHALIIHGDQLCLADRKFKSFHLFSKNPIIQYIFLALPYSWRLAIGKKVRAKSQKKKHTQTSQKILASEKVQKVGTALLENSKCTILIHGHFHVYGAQKDAFGENTYRLGLGDWGSRYSYVKIDHNETKLIQRSIEKNF